MSAWSMACGAALLLVLASGEHLRGSQQCVSTFDRQKSDVAHSWMVGFIERDRDGTEVVTCGGVVVDVSSVDGKTWAGILVARHCMDSRPESVILGQVALGDETKTPRIPIGRHVFNTMLIGDLALVPVQIPMDYRPRPEALPVRTPDPTTDASLTFYSWGQVNGVRSQLWKAEGLRLVQSGRCQELARQHPYERIIFEIGYCAGKEGYEIVPFDSGGALVAGGALVGIASASHCWAGRFSDPHWRVPDESSFRVVGYPDLARCTLETPLFTTDRVKCTPRIGQLAQREIVTGAAGTTNSEMLKLLLGKDLKGLLKDLGPKLTVVKDH